MYQRIVAAIDHSAIGEQVFQQALDVAKSHQARLILVHVLSAEEEGTPLPLPADMDNLYWAPGNELSLEAWHNQWARYGRECQQKLQAYAARANAVGVETEFRQISGSPGRLLCQFSRSWQADLLVVGTHGRSRLGELLLGSVSSYVMHHAPCDVLTVRSLLSPNTPTTSSQAPETEAPVA